jgi:hypothetical protein
MKILIKKFELLPEPAGKDWYREAHALAADLAARHHTTTDVVAAVLSALSPACSWAQNQKDAAALLDNLEHTPVTYGHNARKARSIILKELNPANAFPKTSPKTWNFYNNILYPESRDFVTIDRHAYRIATGQRSLKFGLREYREIAEMYRKASKKLGLLPNELQAILWTNYK